MFFLSRKWYYAFYVQFLLTVPKFQNCKHHTLSCRSLVFSGTVHWFEGRQAFIHYCGLHQVVDESLSSFKPMYCSREYQASTRLSQQYEKSTSNHTLSYYLLNDEIYYAVYQFFFP